MATSTWRQIPEVMEHLEDVAIRTHGEFTALDLGCGWGRYGALIKDTWTSAHVTGVDAMPGRLRWDQGYDRIVYGVLPDIPVTGRFDVVLLLDVIEHLDRGPALQALTAARKLGTVILATPNGFMEQDMSGVDRHRTGWEVADLEALGAIDLCVIPSRQRQPRPNGPGQIVCRFPALP